MQAETRALQVGVIVPVFNEADNVAPLVKRLTEALRGYVWEVIFVDDSSPDGSAARVRAFALLDPRVRCIQRVGRRGLSSAVVEGMLASAAPVLAVVDGDMQHDESVLPAMIKSEEHTSELQSIMRLSYAVFSLKKKTKKNKNPIHSCKDKADWLHIRQPQQLHTIKARHTST